MRLSSASFTSTSKESKAANLSGPRLRKKHKRLDAICEQEYNRNHGDLNAAGGEAGPGSAESELRRSSRVRRPPVLLDVSPTPPKKRRRINKKVTLSADRNVRTSPLVRRNVEDPPETPGSWRSRLRSRGRNVGFEVKEERGFPSGKRKLFEETGGAGNEEKVAAVELVDINSELEVGKAMVVKPKRPGRIKATNDSTNEEKDKGLHLNNEEVMKEELEGIGNKVEAPALQLDSEVGDEIGRNTADDDAKELVDTALQLDHKVGDEVERNTADGDAKELVETEESLQLENRCNCNDSENMGPIEHIDEQAEQLDSVIEVGSQIDVAKDVAISANEEAGTKCHEWKDDKLDGLDEKPQAKEDHVKIEDHVKMENDVRMDKSICALSDKPSKPRVKEGRRCGLCGGGTDGKPPKKLAPDTGESENEACSGSSASEEPNYDIWDGFGDEPGWLGRLLGPVNDRYGIAGIWVHQHCAVWSPEVCSLDQH